MMIHSLKTHPGPFAAIREGRKRFEFRRDDGRNFGIGDMLDLHEYQPDPVRPRFTGREIRV